MRHHFIPTRMAKIKLKIETITRVDKVVEKFEPS